MAGWLIRSSLSVGTEQVVVPHVLSLRVLHNTGVAFGLLAHFPPVATVILALTLLGVVFYNRSAWPLAVVGPWGLGLMLGGALGNMIERLRFGYVLDYLDFHVWPVFNLADAAIVIGAGLLVLAFSRSGRDGSVSRASGPAARARTATPQDDYSRGDDANAVDPGGE